MISRISGKITFRKEGTVFVRNAGITYEMLVPAAVMKAMEKAGSSGEEVEFITYHYYQTEPSRAVPVLIAFQNEIEKEFFEKFISVSGVGPKAACKALVEPFSAIADAIDSGDMSFLRGLPGIGEQRARLIIAKLQGKVGKYGLIRDTSAGSTEVREDIKSEAMEVLMQLQYKKNEAEEMIHKAMKRAPEAKTSEELLNEVYRERKVRDN